MKVAWIYTRRFSAVFERIRQRNLSTWNEAFNLLQAVTALHGVCSLFHFQFPASSLPREVVSLCVIHIILNGRVWRSAATLMSLLSYLLQNLLDPMEPHRRSCCLGPAPRPKLLWTAYRKLIREGHTSRLMRRQIKIEKFSKNTFNKRFLFPLTASWRVTLAVGKIKFGESFAPLLILSLLYTIHSTCREQSGTSTAQVQWASSLYIIL